MKYDINELYPSAQHAYNTIGLAVKTSRPRNKMANFHLSKTHFIFKELPQFIKKGVIVICAFERAIRFYSSAQFAKKQICPAG